MWDRLRERYDAIIFDLGGVLLNLDYELTVAAFNRLAGRPVEFFSTIKQHPIFDDVETGKVTPALFRETLRSWLGSFGEQELDDAWNSMLKDLPLERIRWVAELKRYLRVFLLSNTNAIHKEAFCKIAEESMGYQQFAAAFDHLYFSHEIGLRKPDPNVFRHVLNEQGLSPQRTLFIDDGKHHVQSARSLGIQALHHDVSLFSDVRDLLANHLKNG